MIEWAGEFFPLSVASYARTGPTSARFVDVPRAQEHDVSAESGVLDAVERLLLRCDGYIDGLTLIEAVADPCLSADLAAVLGDLVKLGVVADARNSPELAARLMRRTVTGDPDRVSRAYALPRWKDPLAGNVLPSHTQDIDGVPRVSSLSLDQLLDRKKSGGRGVEPSSSQLVALLAAMYGADRGDRPVPSAGGMWPLVLHALTECPRSGSFDVSWFDDESNRLHRLPSREVAKANLERCMAPNPLVDVGLELGVAVIAISADLARIGLKYGSRATHFAAIEVGATMQRAYEHASSLKLAVRAMGGFSAGRVERLLPMDGLEPMLLLLVASLELP